MHHLSRLVVGLGSAALVACTAASTEPIRLGQEFVTLETGRFIVYDVTEQRYSLTASPTTTTYQLKETVGSRYTDVTGQTAYRLHRYRRATTTTAWTLDSLWTARLTERAIIRTENGIDFVKLQFPLQERDQWNGNQFNQHPENLYQARQVRQPYTIGNQSFAETVQVVQQDDSTLVSRDKRIEVFARQVGLIYKERVQLQYCSAGTCVGKAQIDFGVRQVFKLVAYGTE